MPERDEVREVVFEVWKAEAQHHANLLCVIAGDDLWYDGDDYGVFEDADKAFAGGEDPCTFVERMFADDLASRAHDEEMEREALEAGLDEVEGEFDEEFE